MKRATQTGLLLAVLGCASIAVRADAIGDYKVILDRNPFGLKPMPVPVKVEAPAPPETPTNYKLSGITGLFKPPRAMFVNQVPGKPVPEYLSLSEGQRQGSLEVLPGGIDIKGGKVRVKISGEERTLSFEKDGLRAAAGPPVMTAPGVPSPPYQLNPVPATPGGTVALPAGIPGPQASGNRVVPAMAQPATAAVQGVVGGVVNTSRTMRITPDAAPVQSSPPPAPVIDRAEQVLRMEINRKLTEVQVQRGELPPLPATELSPPSPQLPPLPRAP